MKTQNLEAQLSNALKPVTPRAEFVSQLKAQLSQPSAPARSPVWLIVAGVGGLVSVAGVVVVLFRLGGSLVRRASEALPRSNRMASAPQ